jgi:CRP/FNR family transcriptional regulator
MVPLPSPLTLLNRADFFKGVSGLSKQLLAEICLRKKVRKNETLFQEGDKGQAFYLCADGNIQLSKLSPEGRETVIKVIQSGEFFAEVILFENDRYPVTARALSSGLVYVLPKPQIHLLLNQEAFRNDFIGMLMRKQRYLATRIMDLTAYQVEERFRRFLLLQYGKKIEYRITLSKKDIAAAIGTSPETLSRALLSLHQKRMIEWQGKTIKILPAALTPAGDGPIHPVANRL